MEGDKYCEVCGKYIGNVETYSKGFYSFIKTKYCDECRDMMYAQDRANAMRNYRKRKKKQKKQQEEIKKETTKEFESLKEENELLRKNIIKLREEISKSNISSPNADKVKKIVVRKKVHIQSK